MAMTGDQMKEIPILFSAPMVRATLDGRKTQTRRVINPQPEYQNGLWLFKWGAACSGDTMPVVIGHATQSACPYGTPGDRLWVRENWRVGAWAWGANLLAIDYLADSFYRKDWLRVPSDQFERLLNQSIEDARKHFGVQSQYKWKPGESPCRVRPSIHMPRWASRITLELVNVRVERVQSISEEDAVAEGFEESLDGGDGVFTDVYGHISARENFSGLWDHINAKRGFGWDANPWVWVVEFKLQETPCT